MPRIPSSATATFSDRNLALWTKGMAGWRHCQVGQGMEGYEGGMQHSCRACALDLHKGHHVAVHSGLKT